MTFLLSCLVLGFKILSITLFFPSVASLRLMSPASVTGDVTLFYLKSYDFYFLVIVLDVHTFSFFLKTDDNLFSIILLQATIGTRTLSAFPGDQLSSVLLNSSAENI